MVSEEIRQFIERYERRIAMAQAALALIDGENGNG